MAGYIAGLSEEKKSSILPLLTVTQNKPYKPGVDDYLAGYDGVYLIDVQVPMPTYHSASITITQNTGDNPIKASEQGLDGFDEVYVNVSADAKIIKLDVSANGTYWAPEGYDGFNPVVVNVPDRYDEGYSDGYDKGYDDGYKKGDDDGQEEGYIKGQDSVVLKPFPSTPFDDIMDYIKNNPDSRVKQDGSNYSFVFRNYPFTGKKYPEGTAESWNYEFYVGTEIVVYENGEKINSCNVWYSWPNSDYKLIDWNFDPSSGTISINYATTGGTFTPSITIPGLIGFMQGDNQVTVYK